MCFTGWLWILEKEIWPWSCQKARAAKKAAKKTTKKTKKKSSASGMFDLDDNSESEVALDSLGSFFNYLIDIDYSQDDMGAS